MLLTEAQARQAKHVGKKLNMSSVTLHTPVGIRQSWSIELPWPDRRLSPNARQHWAAAAKAKKAYRSACRALGKASGLDMAQNDAESVLVALVFCPPDRRARDLDNLLASMKSGLDGLADAMGIDDSKWRLMIEMGPHTPGGMVLVEVQA